VASATESQLNGKIGSQTVEVGWLKKKIKNCEKNTCLSHKIHLVFASLLLRKVFLPSGCRDKRCGIREGFL